MFSRCQLTVCVKKERLKIRWTWRGVSFQPMESTAAFLVVRAGCNYFLLLAFHSYISCCPDKGSDRAKQLHSQQINPEHISISYITVSYNAPLTSHTFRRDPRRDPSYKNALHKLENPLLRNQAALCRHMLRQRTYFYSAAPRAA